jgi:hypothetical protein
MMVVDPSEVVIMSTGTSQERHAKAREALESLGIHRSDHRQLSVQCSRSHHLAAVYRTESGLVYLAISGPHAHGSKDRIDTAHHGARRGTEYVDLLVADPDDGLPAWCDCGTHTLSRSALIEEAAGHPHTVRVE